MLFATNHNFLVFHPASMVQKNPPPDVKILDFKVANKSLLVDSIRKLSKITLDFNKNSIGIDFGTLSYLRNNKKVFYYSLRKLMMTGFVQTTATRQCTITCHPAIILSR